VAHGAGTSREEGRVLFDCTGSELDRLGNPVGVSDEEPVARERTARSAIHPGVLPSRASRVCLYTKRSSRSWLSSGVDQRVHGWCWTADPQANSGVIRNRSTGDETVIRADGPRHDGSVLAIPTRFDSNRSRLVCSFQTQVRQPHDAVVSGVRQVTTEAWRSRFNLSTLNYSYTAVTEHARDDAREQRRTTPSPCDGPPRFVCVRPTRRKRHRAVVWPEQSVSAETVAWLHCLRQTNRRDEEWNAPTTVARASRRPRAVGRP
jgi:hypothetical protein